MIDLRAPSLMQAEARERLLRAAERCRELGRHDIADGITAGALDNLPESYAQGIASAPGLGVVDVPHPPGWMVVLVGTDCVAEFGWSYWPDKEVSR